MKWKTIADERVRHVWHCGDPRCLEQPAVKVAPTFYEEAGTPVCEECGQDMTYDCTEIKQ